MAIPPLTSFGLLPPGIHNATLAEVENMFGSANDKRVALFKGLSAYADLLTEVGVFKGIFIDGSFVTDKPVPGDIDVIVDVDVPGMIKLLAHSLKDQIVDASAVKHAYGLHLFFAPQAPTLLNYFQHLRVDEAILRKAPPSQMRGIVRVTL